MLLGLIPWRPRLPIHGLHLPRQKSLTRNLAVIVENEAGQSNTGVLSTGCQQTRRHPNRGGSR